MYSLIRNLFKLRQNILIENDICMNILIFLNDLNGGGAEKIMVGFLNYLSEHTRDNITLLLVKKKGPYGDIIHPRVKVVDLQQSSIVYSLPALLRYCRQEQIDVIYSTLAKANLVSVIAGLLLRKKAIIRVPNSLKELRKSQKSFKQKSIAYLCGRLYKYASSCIAISEVVKRDVVAFTNCQPEKVHVIYNPVIIIDKGNGIELDPGVFHIALVSRLTTQKNIVTVAKVIERFAATPHKITFHFFGEGKEDVLLKQIIHKYADKCLVRLHGFDISYFSSVKNMDMFLHIPLWEGLGNSVLEVYNSGIPMILSDVESGYSELVKKEYPNDHYVQPLNTDEIVAVIQDYLARRIPVEPSRVKLDLSTTNIYGAYRALADK